MKFPSRAVFSALAVVGFFALIEHARADEIRYDHRGSLGLLVEGGYELRESPRQTGPFQRCECGRLGLGATWGVSDRGGTLIAMAHSALSPKGIVAWDVQAGYRSYFGPERFKTFAEVDAVGRLFPQWSVGPRVALGVQYEIAPVFGVYAGIGGQIGFGSEITYGVDGFLGLQFRSYLLE